MRPLSEQEKKEYIINRQGKDFILFKGLVHLGHEQGLCQINTEVVALPSEANHETTYMKAMVTLRDAEGVERTYAGHGDANSGNAGKMVALHLPRMAETRAIARALRFALDIGYTAFEEVGGEEDEQDGQQRGSQRAAPQQPKAEATPARLVKATAEQQERIKRLLEATGQSYIPADLSALTQPQALDMIANLARALEEREQAQAAPPEEVPAADRKGPATEYTMKRIRKNLREMGREAEFEKLPAMTEMRASSYLAMLQNERARAQPQSAGAR